MSKEKLDAIAIYLKEKSGSLDVEQKYDFDRACQSFKLHRNDGSRLLKVSDEFVADNSIADILRSFDRWKLTDALVGEDRCGILATARGLESFDRC